jgi:arylsulfatase
MAEHDHWVGKLLDTLDDLGIADNTLVIYSTDNGSQTFTYPDGGIEPFRGAKGSTWEGGFRVPLLVRWPGVIDSGRVINDVFHHMDWFPTLMTAVGESGIVRKLRAGHGVAGKQYRVHLDGVDQTQLLTGDGPGQRNTVFYFDDNANLNAVRWNDWKVHFATPDSWGADEARNVYTIPRPVHLRSDPFEESLDFSSYSRFMADQIWLFVPVQHVVGSFLQTFKAFPPRQPTASFTIDKALQRMNRALEQRPAPPG